MWHDACYPHLFSISISIQLVVSSSAAHFHQEPILVTIIYRKNLTKLVSTLTWQNVIELFFFFFSSSNDVMPCVVRNIFCKKRPCSGLLRRRTHSCTTEHLLQETKENVVLSACLPPFHHFNNVSD